MFKKNYLSGLVSNMGNTVVHNKDDVLKCIRKKDAFKTDKKMSDITLDGNTVLQPQ